MPKPHPSPDGSLGGRAKWLADLVSHGALQRGRLMRTVRDPTSGETIHHDLHGRYCPTCGEWHLEAGAYCTRECQQRAFQRASKFKRATGAN